MGMGKNNTKRRRDLRASGCAAKRCTHDTPYCVHMIYSCATELLFRLPMVSAKRYKLTLLHKKLTAETAALQKLLFLRAPASACERLRTLGLWRKVSA